MRKSLGFLFLLGALIAASLSAQVPDSIQTALDRQPGPGYGGYTYIERDHVVALDSVLVQRYDPPAVYQQWWAEVQSCIGLKNPRPFTDYAWVAVNADGFLVNGGKQPVPGYAYVETRNFVLILKKIMDERMVKHEMAHAVAWESTKAIGHSEEWWVRCEIIA